jgi:hypothetical protein
MTFYWRVNRCVLIWAGSDQAAMPMPLFGWLT